MEVRCLSYCGLACIDGTCPKANFDEYAERGYTSVRDCDECYFYKGCDDCYFIDSEYCDNFDNSG